MVIKGQMKLVLGRVGDGVLNLALQKRERIITGGKGRGEITGEVGKVTEVIAGSVFFLEYYISKFT